MNEQYQEALIHQFDPLVHRIVRSYGFTPYHADYQDYLQELRLDLLKVAVGFEGDPLKDEETCYQFVAYANKALRWKLLNLLKRHKYQQVATDSLVLSQLLDKELLIEEGLGLEFDDLVERYLSPREQKVLRLLCQGNWTQKEISQLCQVSERTVRLDKKRIGAKLSKYL